MRTRYPLPRALSHGSALVPWPGVTTIDLRTLTLRSGEQVRQAREVELDAFELGGETYELVPERPEAAVTISRLTSGVLFELKLDAQLSGPCFRCLADAGVTARIRAREYAGTSAGDADELRSPYLVDDRLELSVWARDSVALVLPEKILCRPECAGLCAGCGADLNSSRCTCGPPEPDARWAALAALRDRL